MTRGSLLLIGVLAAWTEAYPAEPVAFSSPGLPPSRLTEGGQLVEDWGTVHVRLSGEGITPGGNRLEAVRLDGEVPAARWSGDFGPARLTITAYKAPVFPDGMDVLTVMVAQTGAEPRRITLELNVTPAVKVGLSTARLDDRVVLSIPWETQLQLKTRDWGYTIDTTPMPNWAKPEGPCDPAFANIRAGMGGIPIRYRFRVAPRTAAQVVLGICESFYGQAGIRPLLCEVEGARPVLVDPVARWGRHRPGALLFSAKDEDADGWISLAINPVPGARDRNPILNAIWVFSPEQKLNLAEVIGGRLNGQARYYVDVGGENDQALFITEGLRFPLELAAGEVKELTFYVACGKGASPVPGVTAWTPSSVFQAAKEVWQGWMAR